MNSNSHNICYKVRNLYISCRNFSHPEKRGGGGRFRHSWRVRTGYSSPSQSDHVRLPVAANTRDENNRARKQVEKARM